jgi:hypothetical protein
MEVNVVGWSLLNSKLAGQVDVIEKGLQIESVYQDPDLIEVGVVVANGAFSGAACFYTSESELRAAASMLKGFPSNASDRREIRLGETVWERVDGIRATFLCRDGLGHVVAEVTLTTDERELPMRQSVSLLLATEAAAVDAFVAELAALAQNRRGAAFLRSAG